MKQELDGWSEKQPNKPIMFTEYGADTLAGLHSVNDELFTEEYQVRYYEANHEVIDQYPHLLVNRLGILQILKLQVALLEFKAIRKAYLHVKEDRKQWHIT